MIGAAFGLGFTFGPMIGGIMSRISYSAPFYFAAALAAGERRVALLHPAREPIKGRPCKAA
jgi:MFS family permease